MELAALSAEFPEFDKALMEGLLEDQGGDVDEVRIYLKVRLFGIALECKS